jgi:uncharacterized protein (DUF433 family)
MTGILRLFPLTRKRPILAQGSPKSRVSSLLIPRVAFGGLVISGSRIPTVEIAERFKAGGSLEDLSGDFRRPTEEIEEAVRVELDLEAA